ncbi:aldehyde dehydrogenase family protein [Actinacidiphila glaucinigra]
MEGYIARGLDEGARLTTGGGRPAGLDRGWFVEPAVLTDVDNTSVVAQEETFGPVLTIRPYDGEDEAVRLANDSAYGLAGTIWTADTEHGTSVARRIRSGTVGMNGYVPDIGSPYGGVKSSGPGRELARRDSRRTSSRSRSTGRDVRVVSRGPSPAGRTSPA